MNNESDYCMSYRMSEAQRLELQIIRDEERWSTLFDTLMERDLIEPSKETDRLLEDWNNLNTRIEHNDKMSPGIETFYIVLSTIFTT